MANYDMKKIEKIANVESIEALKALAKENGVEMSDEDAKISFDQIKNGVGELNDDELENVAGGLRRSAAAFTSASSNLCLASAISNTSTARLEPALLSSSVNASVAYVISNSATNPCLTQLLSLAEL